MLRRMAEFREQFPGRAEMIEMLRKREFLYRLALPSRIQWIASLHISFESEILEDPWFDSTPESKSMYASASPEDAPDSPEYVQMLFEKGNVVGLQFDGIEEAWLNIE